MPGSNFVFRSEARAIGHFKRNYILQMASEPLWVQWMMCWKASLLKHTHTHVFCSILEFWRVIVVVQCWDFSFNAKNKWSMSNYWIKWKYEERTSQPWSHWFSSCVHEEKKRPCRPKYIKIELSGMGKGKKIKRSQCSLKTCSQCRAIEEKGVGWKTNQTPMQEARQLNGHFTTLFFFLFFSFLLLLWI